MHLPQARLSSAPAASLSAKRQQWHSLSFLLFLVPLPQDTISFLDKYAGFSSVH
jgi:hypothetical protein